MNRIISICILCGLGVGPLPTSAAPAHALDSPSTTVPHTLGAEWIAVDPARLASMRGGLQLPSGPLLSFGIDRLVYVNGDLVASTRLHVPDIAHMTSGEAAALATLNQGMVVQVGDGNVITAGTNTNGLVIQNTLDNQDIRALTSLQVGVGTLGMLQEINSFGALHDAIIASPTGP